MSEWLEHSVQTDIPVPIELVWNLWSNIELMPNWMKWLESVTIVPEQPELSRWKLATRNFQFTWQSKILKEIPHQIIQWESVDGLPNRGAIRFYDRKGSSIVKLTVAYAVPGWLALLMDNGFVRQSVDSSLTASMERFRNYAISAASTTPSRSIEQLRQ
jgi:uncharacterized membrane protein